MLKINAIIYRFIAVFDGRNERPGIWQFTKASCYRLRQMDFSNQDVPVNRAQPDQPRF